MSWVWFGLVGALSASAGYWLGYLVSFRGSVRFWHSLVCGRCREKAAAAAAQAVRR